MTVCAAVKHGDTFYIATDSRINHGDTGQYRDSQQDKFLKLGEQGVKIAICGEVRVEQIIERFLKEVEQSHLLIITGIDSVMQLGDAILERLRTMLKNDDLNTMRDTYMLIVSEASDKIYVMDPDFTVIDYHDYAAIGAGGEVASAAILAGKRYGKTGKNLLQTAMEVACAMNSTCGGEIWMDKLKIQD